MLQEAHGFELQRQQWIKEYDSHMLIYKHKKTGGWVCRGMSWSYGPTMVMIHEYEQFFQTAGQMLLYGVVAHLIRVDDSKFFTLPSLVLLCCNLQVRR